MTIPIEISQDLFASRAELSPNRSRDLLNSALSKCEEWESTGGGIPATVVKAQVLAEMVNEENISSVRVKLWKKAFSTLDSVWKDHEIEISNAYASLAVDCFQDQLTSLDLATRLRFLRAAKDYLDSTIRETKDDLVKAELLSRKSSVLRHLSIGDFDERIRLNRLEESLGCASLAVRIHKGEPALLELALSEWARARFEETDEKYVSRLRRAEELLRDKLLSSNELAQLSLARFYRLTFRQLDACEKFDSCIANTGNMRRLLRDSYIFSEAAIQLWYAKYPEDLLRKHLCQARDLLESAVAAGYQNARILTSLAFARAILEDAKAGNSVLSEIHRENLSVSWDEALKLAAEVDESEPLQLGFVLGFNQSAVWTILGTYSLKFLNDPYLTEVLYRAAIRLDRHNPVALTNLARFLLRRGTQEALTEAGRLLQKAQNFADRRFTWWRVVLAELEKLSVIRPEKDIARRSVGDMPVRPKPFVDLKQLRQHFRRIEQLDDLQQRGYELERLVYEAARITFDMAAPPYRCERDNSGRIRQIDGYFEQPPEKYRVECKWQRGLSDHNDIVLFGDSLNVVGVSGLFISMSGFTPSAVAAAKQLSSTKAILLMDGDEVKIIFKGQMNFDGVMRRKRLYFDLKSEVYHRVVPSPVAS